MNDNPVDKTPPISSAFSASSALKTSEELNKITRTIIGAAIDVHKFLGGPGLIESAYEEAMVEELRSRGLGVRRQVSCPIVYKGKRLESPLRIDLLVDECVIVELKAVSSGNPVFAAQCLTYLRMTGLRVGLVINFGLQKLVDGIERVVNNV